MMIKKIYRLILCLTLLVVLFVPNPAYAESQSENLYKSGNAYAAQRQYGMAINNYTQAIELDPQYVKAYLNRGLSYRYISRNDLAIADYTKAIEINPQYAESYYSRGLVYYLTSNEMAIVDYTKAIELNPQHTEYYIKRADAYRGKARHDLAMDDYNQVLKINPDDHDAYINKYNLLKYAGCEFYDYYDSDLRNTSYNPFRKN